jgi:hypothetical protein
MIPHGFVKMMWFLGEGVDVDQFVHDHGKTNRVGRVAYKAFATHRIPDGLICTPWYEHITQLFLFW